LFFPSQLGANAELLLFVERTVCNHTTARHLHIPGIQFNTEETAAQPERHDAGCAGAAERIQYSARTGFTEMLASRLSPLGGWRGEGSVVILAGLTPRPQIGQHPSATRMCSRGAPLSLVIDWMH
jgi:hypothetical protein